jgi:hypothetical protein
MIITELFDLHKNYHDALGCIFQRDGSIKELEAKIASRDEHIASLELRLVRMSLELASSKAMEDEHRLFKRRVSNLSMSNLSNHSASTISLSHPDVQDETEECGADIGGDEGQPAGGWSRPLSSRISQSLPAPRSKSLCMSLVNHAPLAVIPQAKSEAADASAVGGDTDRSKPLPAPRSKSWCMSLVEQAPLADIPQAKSEAADASAVGDDMDRSKPLPATRSNYWCTSLVEQAPLAVIPQAKSEAADASAVGGDTDRSKQFVLQSPFRRYPNEPTCGSTDSSENPLDTRLNVRCLDESLRKVGTISRCGANSTDPYPIPSFTRKLKSRRTESYLFVDYPRRSTSRLRCEQSQLSESSSKIHENVIQFFQKVTKEWEGSRHRATPTIPPTSLRCKKRLSLESSISGIPCVVFPVTSADCLIGCDVIARPKSSSSGRSSDANAEWVLSKNSAFKEGGCLNHHFCII